MSELYCVMTVDGCYEPYISTPYERIIPEHRTPHSWKPEQKPAPPPVPTPTEMEKEESRKAIMRNLLRIGHPIEEVERLYGPF